MSDFDARMAVYTPPEASTYGVERIQLMEQQRHRAMPIDIPEVGQYLAPLMPGEICAVVAQSSNGKSTFMNIWEHQLASYLKRQGRTNEVIFHIDAETTIEGLAIQEIARYSSHTVADLSRGNVRDWSEVFQAAARIADIDIYRIGGSLGRDAMPDLYLSNIYRAIDFANRGELTGESLQPAAIFVDYLQALPIDPEVKQGSPEMKNQRRLQVREDVYRLRRMAAHFQCPVVVGVQAKQELSGAPGANMLIPGLYDGEETSSIAQRFDRIVSLWMPKMTHTIGQSLKHGDIRFDVTEDLMWVKVVKQRGGLPSGRAWPCAVDFRGYSIGRAMFA